VWGINYYNLHDETVHFQVYWNHMLQKCSNNSVTAYILCYVKWQTWSLRQLSQHAMKKSNKKKKPAKWKFWRRNILSCDSILLYSQEWQASLHKTGKISRHGSEYVNILCANQLALQKRKCYRRYIPYLNIIEMHCIIIRDETNPHTGFLSSFILG